MKQQKTKAYIVIGNKNRLRIVAKSFEIAVRSFERLFPNDLPQSVVRIGKS